MGNNPFIPVTFKDTVPKGLWNTYSGPWEDGPGPYTNPPNSSTVVRYNGQDQVSRINSAYLPPPTSPAKCTLPGAADKNESKIK